MAISKDFVQSVRKSIEEQPAVEFGVLARALHAKEADVITALPVAMRLKARNTAFEAIWNSMARWDEFGGIRIGEKRHGIPLSDGLALKLLKQEKLKISTDDGVLSYEAIRDALGYIWFISRQEQKDSGHTICFLDKNGNHLFSVVLAQDHRGTINPSQFEDFEDMKKRFGVVPIPKNRCKGCKGCTCQAAGVEGLTAASSQTVSA